jgi:transposase
LRELLRYRRKLTESQAAERNRLLRLLETANIKLASVASDVFGVSGRAMLKALIEGVASAEEMAALAKGSLRRKHAELVLALEGRMHHRFVLMMQLRRLETAEQDIAALDQRIAEKLEPYGAQHLLLMQRALASKEVAGPAKATSTCARSWSAPRFLHPEPGAATLKDKYHRLKARRGPMRAALAIVHKILVAAYHMLAKGIAYQDLGETYLDQIRQTRTVANLKRRIERLGYQVTLEPKAQAA